MRGASVMRFLLISLLLLFLAGCDSRRKPLPSEKAVQRSDAAAAPVQETANPGRTAELSAAGKKNTGRSVSSEGAEQDKSQGGGISPAPPDGMGKGGSGSPMRFRLEKENRAEGNVRNANEYRIWRAAVDAVRGMIKEPDSAVFSNPGVKDTSIRIKSRVSAVVEGRFIARDARGQDEEAFFECEVLFIEDEFFAAENITIKRRDAK